MAEGRVHPSHESIDFCILKIAELKELMEQLGLTTDGPASSDYPDQAEDHHVQQSGREEHDNDNDNDDDDDNSLEENVEVENTQLKEWKKKLVKLNLKLDETRKAYDTAMVAELKRSEPSTESRGISKEKRIDERKKTIGKQLDGNGHDMKKASDMLDTQEAAENKYEKCENKPAPFGSDVSNQKTLCDADKKLTKDIEFNVGEYNKMKEAFLRTKMKEADPEFYGDASSSLQYGKAPKISEDKICKMVKELLKKGGDSIDDHNENFSKIIERAYSEYTREIKNKLERETGLQGCVGGGLFTFCIGVAALNCIWVSIR